MCDDVILEVKNLSYSYDGVKKIFANIDFELRKGEVLVILGANGAGKSTLLDCISNMLTPTKGEILLKGKNIAKYAINDVAKLMGYVPQISTPTFSYTVRDYIVMGRAPHMGILNVPGPAEYDKVDEVMKEMWISGLADKIYANISGGERQQAQIARILVQETDIILLDEPTNHLDYGNQLKIIQIISKLARNRGLTVVLTSHIPDHAIMIDEKVGIMDNLGHMTVGPVKEVISEESLRELYHTDLHLVYIDELKRIACVAGKLNDENRK